MQDEAKTKEQLIIELKALRQRVAESEKNPAEHKRWEAALAQSEQRFRSLFERNRAIMLLIEHDSGAILDANKGAVEFYGYSRTELCAMNIAQINQLPREVVADACPSILEPKTNSFVFPHRLSNGEVRTVEVYSYPVEMDGRMVLFSIVYDITERDKHAREIKLINRLYSVLSRVSQAVARATSPEKFLEQACREVVEGGVFILAWIGQVELMTNAVVPTAFCGGIGEYVQGITVYADSRPEGSGPTGICIREHHPVVHNDFLHDPQTLPWRDRAAPFGIAAAAAFPIERAGGVWGALTIYSDEVDRFGDEDVKLLAKVAGDIGFALDNLDREFRRKQAEEALLESENKFKSFAENALVGIYLLQDGVFKYVNPKFAQMFGYTVEECLNDMHYKNLVYPEDLTKVEEQVRKRVSGEVEFVYYTFRGLKKNGQSFHVEVYSSNSNYKGRPAATGTMLDITERKRGEEALRESEQRLSQIIDFLPDATFAIDLNGKVIAWNRAIEEMTGVKAEQILGRGDYEYALPFYGIRRPILIDLVFTSDEEIKNKYHFVKKEGDILLAEADAPVRSEQSRALWGKARPLYDSEGNIVGAIEAIRDITDRKQAEEDLKQINSYLENIFENSPDAIAIADNHGRFIRWNKMAEDLYGYTFEEMKAKSAFDLYADKDEIEKMLMSLRREGSVKNWEMRMTKKDGSIVPFEISIGLLKDSQKETLGSVGVARDLSGIKKTLAALKASHERLYREIGERIQAEKERKKLEAQLFQAQKMESVGRLAGGVAHDFNNMLGVIIGRAELALQTDVSADQLQHNLKEILNAGLRSADLTKQLLAFARKQTAIPHILDLNRTISGMLNMLRRLVGEDINLLWAPELDLWKIKIDPSQVDQILANLVVNARDAISGVGAITIKTDNVVIEDSNRAETPEFLAGQYVLLTVSDTGAGMSLEVRENIFEPFFTTKEVGKGTGLGLSTVYGIVKQNDGFIYVVSEPGDGTTFRIYLPRFEAETAQVPSEEEAGKRPTGMETILLVEDDEAILSLGKMILENLGYTVRAAQTPGHAIHLAEEHQGDLDLLITDVVMPEMNGRELAEKVRVIRPQLKCLYMSGYTADVIAHRGILDEGLNFIQKPFLSDDLAAKVRQVLDHLE
jgi:two-component system, cell cycle sensor histidine kinase and response regulator CckA